MQTGSVGSIHEYWEGSDVEDAVFTGTLLSDINQPYSCAQWANLAPKWVIYNGNLQKS